MKKLFYVLILLLVVSCSSNNKQKEMEEANRKADSILLQAQQDYEKKKAERTNSLNKENVEQKRTKDKSFEGTYYCARSGDTYVFNDTHFGDFTPNGSDVSYHFYWTKNGSKLIVKFIGDDESFGSTTLTYKKKSQQLIEKSMSYGTLVFEKEEEF